VETPTPNRPAAWRADVPVADAFNILIRRSSLTARAIINLPFVEKLNQLHSLPSRHVTFDSSITGFALSGACAHILLPNGQTRPPKVDDLHQLVFDNFVKRNSDYKPGLLQLLQEA
jgi:hypothetical protein